MEQIENLYQQRSELQDKAIALVDELQNNSETTVEDWNALGHELFMLQLPVDAEKAYLKAIELAEQFTGSDRKALIVFYGDLSGVYESMEEYNKALEYLKKSYELRVEFYGKDNLFSRMSADRIRKLELFTQYIPDQNLEKDLRASLKVD